MISVVFIRSVGSLSVICLKINNIIYFFVREIKVTQKGSIKQYLRVFSVGAFRVKQESEKIFTFSVLFIIFGAVFTKFR